VPVVPAARDPGSAVTAEGQARLPGRHAAVRTAPERSAPPRRQRGAPAISPGPRRSAALSRLAASRAGRDGALLAGYLTAGVAVTWPRVSYLAGQLPALRDTGGYVWDLWWVARQVSHLNNPWFTRYLAAPAGADLGYHTLMPLPGVLLLPVTACFGPSVSYNLLAVACPGLLCYVMYRAARLWVPSWPGAGAAGALFGLSSQLTWRSWYEINLALGALFLPMALEASVRLKRKPSRRQAVILGLVLGGALLTDQESAVLAAILCGLVLIPWLVRHPARVKLRHAALAAVTGIVAASPQIAAMAQQAMAGGAATPAGILARSYQRSGAALAQLVAPSPRLASYGLGSLAALYYQGRPALAVTGYGFMLSALAVAGLMAAWRRPAARLLALLWLGSSALALGSQPWLVHRPYLPMGSMWHGVPVSMVMPYTWLVRLPGLASFREADRFTELGLLAAALLAGAAVTWLRLHARAVLAAAVALSFLEAGWSGNPPGHQPIGVMPAALPAVDGPIAADRSGSIVIDVPFGIRGLPVLGATFPPEALVLATADGHPLADAFISRIPHTTLTGIKRRRFYAGLLTAQGSHRHNTPAMLRAAARNARHLHIGWVLVWVPSPAITRYLQHTGFRLAYHADGVAVYRPSAATSRPAAPQR
jgi:hypothetical protein